MKSKNLILVYFLFLFLLSNNAIASTTYTANANSSWHSETTWLPNGIPTADDDVIINGFNVSIDDMAFAKSIYITNFNEMPSSLTISDTLTVFGNVEVEDLAINQWMELIVNEYSKFTIHGNLDISRNSNNNGSLAIYFEMSQFSKTYVLGNFTYDYQNSENNENSDDIAIYGEAIFDVSGQTKLLTRNGEDLDFMLYDASTVTLRDSVSLLLEGGNQTAITADGDSHLRILSNVFLQNSGGSNHTKLKAGESSNSTGKITVTGNIYTESTASGLHIRLQSFTENSEFNAMGDIILKAVEEDDVVIHLKNTAKLNLGGNILRPNIFGALKMESNASINFNGSESQTISKSHIPGAGKDSLQYLNLEINNTSDEGIQIEGNITIADTLKLSNGVVYLDPNALLILEENAVVSGASSSAYVNGPVLKKGQTEGSSFTFPVGSSTTYAPISISRLTNSSSAVQAEFVSDPPPWGSNYASQSKINNVDNNSWVLTKTGTEDVSVTVHWNDPTAAVINDPDSLVVARLNVDNQEWENFGKSSAVNNGTSGTVTSSRVMSDPPPWGSERFTLASTSSLNFLPVELTNFQAIQKDNHVYLQWETLNESNTDEFEIERSIDGITFESIGIVFSNGSSNYTQNYSFKDLSPTNGTSYYRLKIVDSDFTFVYSHIEVVYFDDETKLKVFPNPVKDLLNIESDFKDFENVRFEIYDRNGQQVYMGILSFDNGRIIMETESLNIKNPGTYFIQITNQSGSYIQKFIKVK